MPSYADQMYGYYFDEMTLSHHGVLGQRWGVRRYQNEDGSLTSAGKKRLETNKSLASEFRSDASNYAQKGRLVKAYASNKADKRFQRNADKLIKAEYKSAKKSIRDTKDTLLNKDLERIEDHRTYGKIGNPEATRQSNNAFALRGRQARARRLAAKSEMNAKLAENSTGISKAIREARSKHEAKRAEDWSKAASRTKKMINITNDVYKKRLGTGEKIASEFLMTTGTRNRYYSNRANMSAAQSLGRTIIENMMEYPFYE